MRKLINKIKDAKAEKLKKKQSEISNTLMLENDELARIKKEREELSKGIVIDLKQEKEYRERCDKARTTLEDLNAEIERRNEKRNNIEQEIVTAQNMREELIEEGFKLGGSVNEQKQKEIEAIQNLIDRATQELEDVRKYVVNAQDDFLLKNEELAGINNKIENAQILLERKEQSIIDADNNIEIKNRELKKLDNWIESKNFTNEEYEKKIVELRDTISKTNEEVTVVKKELKVEQEELGFKNEELEKASNKVLGLLKREEKMNKLIPKIKKIAAKAGMKIDLD